MKRYVIDEISRISSGYSELSPADLERCINKSILKTWVLALVCTIIFFILIL